MTHEHVDLIQADANISVMYVDVICLTNIFFTSVHNYSVHYKPRFCQSRTFFTDVLFHGVSSPV